MGFTTWVSGGLGLNYTVWDRGSGFRIFKGFLASRSQVVEGRNIARMPVPRACARAFLDPTKSGSRPADLSKVSVPFDVITRRTLVVAPVRQTSIPVPTSLLGTSALWWVQDELQLCCKKPENLKP